MQPRNPEPESRANERSVCVQSSVQYSAVSWLFIPRMQQEELKLLAQATARLTHTLPQRRHIHHTIRLHVPRVLHLLIPSGYCQGEGESEGWSERVRVRGRVGVKLDSGQGLRSGSDQGEGWSERGRVEG